MEWREWQPKNVPEVDLPGTYEFCLDQLEDVLSKICDIKAEELRNVALGKRDEEEALRFSIYYTSVDQNRIEPPKFKSRQSRELTIKMILRFYIGAIVTSANGNQSAALKAVARAFAYLNWYKNVAGGNIDSHDVKPLDIAFDARLKKIAKEKRLFIQVVEANLGLIKNRYPASLIKDHWDIFKVARAEAGLDDTDDIKFLRRINDWRSKDLDFKEQVDLIFLKNRIG